MFQAPLIKAVGTCWRRMAHTAAGASTISQQLRALADQLDRSEGQTDQDTVASIAKVAEQLRAQQSSLGPAGMLAAYGGPCHPCSASQAIRISCPLHTGYRPTTVRGELRSTKCITTATGWPKAQEGKARHVSCPDRHGDGCTMALEEVDGCASQGIGSLTSASTGSAMWPCM